MPRATWRNRKLLPSLAQIQERGLLSEQFCLLGCGRTEYSDDQFRQLAADAIRKNSGGVSTEASKTFLDKLYYLSGDYGDAATYDRIKSRLAELRQKHNVDGCNVFYLSVPPFLYQTIIERIGAAGLSGKNGHECEKRVRLMVEKPFGRDLQSATELNNTISKWFDESQVYRIDHYLGKETVQNIMIFRFANAIFEPIWNRNHIDNIQITIAETLGVEHRADYYDKSGALRDIFQNHMLQMLALVAMEPPISFDADRVRDEKVKLLRAVRPFACGCGAAGRRDFPFSLPCRARPVRARSDRRPAGARLPPGGGRWTPIRGRRRSSPPGFSSTTGDGRTCPSTCVPASGWRKRTPRSS